MLASSMRFPKCTALLLPVLVLAVLGCERDGPRARNRFAADVESVRDATRLLHPVKLRLPHELAVAWRAAAASRTAFLAACEKCASAEWCEEEAHRIERDPGAARDDATACP
jgi:hypothetical protein